MVFLHPSIFCFFPRSRLNIFKGKRMIEIVLKPRDCGAGDCGIGNNAWDKTAVRLRETNEVSIKLHRDLRPRPTGSFCSQRSWALGHILADCGQECFNCWKWFILFLWPPHQLCLVLFKWSQLAWFFLIYLIFLRETNHVCFWFVLLLIIIHLKVYKAGWHVWFKIMITHPKFSQMERVPPCKGLHTDCSSFFGQEISQIP